MNLIHSNFAEIDPDKEYFLHCKTGYRSLIATSILKANGVKVTNQEVGMKLLKNVKQHFQSLFAQQLCYKYPHIFLVKSDFY